MEAGDICKYSITCQDDLLTVDNAQSHVTAFRPISEAARSWSDDKFKFKRSKVKVARSRDVPADKNAITWLSMVISTSNLAGIIDVGSKRVVYFLGQ